MLLAGRVIRIICVIFMAMFVVSRIPLSILVIPILGGCAIYVINEIEDMKNESKKTKKRNSRNKKVTRKQS